MKICCYSWFTFWFERWEINCNRREIELETNLEKSVKTITTTTTI